MKDLPHSVGTVTGSLFQLLPEEAQHLYQVLRKQPGDHIIGLDGNGQAFEVELTSISRKQGEGEILQTWNHYGQVKGFLHIAMAPPKSQDRLNTFLEKAVEMGIHEFTPIIAERSERRKVNVDRLRRVMIAACKQSHKGLFPTVNEPISLQKFIDAQPAGAMALCFGQRDSWHSYVTSQSLCTLLIGPEGDFTDNELALAVAKGWKPVHLGHHRLRTETAGLQAVAQYAGWINQS